MVEMLGVLAVIGVLSVAGIAGFKNAMDKQKANTIINEAQKRATLAVAQIQMRGNTNPTLNEFSANDLGFDSKVYTETDGLPEGQFGIKISGVSQEVCQNILKIVGNNSVIRRLATTEIPKTAMTTCGDDNTFLMVYNNDMSANAAAGEFGYDDCPESFYVCPTTNSCVASENNCPTCESTYSGATANGEGGYSGTVGITRCYCEYSGDIYDATNGCHTKTITGCGSFADCDKGYFCNFDTACATTGTCKAVSQVGSTSGSVTVSNLEYTAVCSDTSLNSFYKAEDWCLAQGGRLVTAVEICNRTENSYGACPIDKSATILRSQLKTLCNAGDFSDWMWVFRSDNNRSSCYMFSAVLRGAAKGTYEYGSKTDRRGVCFLPK